MKHIMTNPQDLIGQRLARRLSEAADQLPHDITERLRVARQQALQQALTQLSALNVAWVVPGHGAASQDFKQDLLLTLNYLQFVRTSMLRAVEEGLSFEEAYEVADWSQFKHLPLFGAANRMNAFNIFLQLEQEVLKR